MRRSTRRSDGAMDHRRFPLLPALALLAAVGAGCDYAPAVPPHPAALYRASFASGPRVAGPGGRPAAERHHLEAAAAVEGDAQAGEDRARVLRLELRHAEDEIARIAVAMTTETAGA